MGVAWYWRTFPGELSSLRSARREHAPLYLREDPEPLVSVVIPTYNQGRILVGRALPSILRQTYRRLDVVVVGDGSPGESVDCWRTVRDPRVRFENLAQRGVYPADPLRRHRVAGSAPMNRALELARGDWIAPCEDDDVFTPDHVEMLLRHAQAHDSEWVTGSFLEEREPGVLSSAVDPSRNWTVQTRTAISCWLFRTYLRSFKFDLSAWRYHMNGDYGFKHRLIRAGVRMAYLDAVVTHKLLRPGESELYHGF